MAQSTRFQVPITAQRKLFIILPSLKEQKAIAKILSDMDSLIVQTEKLIEKKKAIKKGLMQELLKPRAGWVTKKLGEVCEIIKGSQLNRNTLTPSGDYPVYNGGVSPSGFTSIYNTLPNTVIISEGGNSCGYVNFIQKKFWRGGHCYSIVPKKLLHIRFGYFLLKNNESKIMALRVGSGLPNIQKSRLANFEISYPEIDEQVNTANILSHAENEISKTEYKLHKLNLLKQAMMQSLLSGKIRMI